MYSSGSINEFVYLLPIDGEYDNIKSITKRKNSIVRREKPLWGINDFFLSGPQDSRDSDDTSCCSSPLSEGSQGNTPKIIKISSCLKSNVDKRIQELKKNNLNSLSILINQRRNHLMMMNSSPPTHLRMTQSARNVLSGVGICKSKNSFMNNGIF